LTSKIEKKNQRGETRKVIAGARGESSKSKWRTGGGTKKKKKGFAVPTQLLGVVGKKQKKTLNKTNEYRI